MRKYMSSLMLMVLGGSMAAVASDEVTSVNIVGYNTSTISSNKYYMVCVPFYQMGASNSIQTVVSNALIPGSSSSSGDNVLFYNNPSQTYVARNWYRATDKTWYEGGSVSTQSVDQGRCFWVKSNHALSNSTFVLMGEVVTDNVITQRLYQGYNMIGYPYNINVSVTNTVLNSIAYGSTSASKSDNIIKWDPVSQTYATYWRRNDGLWYQGGSVVAPDLLVGEAIWYKRSTNAAPVDWVEIKPYSL